MILMPLETDFQIQGGKNTIEKSKEIKPKLCKCKFEVENI